MTHGRHQGRHQIFADDCEECIERASTIAGLASLDAKNIKKLGDLAFESRLLSGVATPPMSLADAKAIENLRLAARIVFASKITEEVAR